MLRESLVPVIIEDLCFDINAFLGHKGHLVGIRTPNLQWETCAQAETVKKNITKIQKYLKICSKMAQIVLAQIVVYD